MIKLNKLEEPEILKKNKAEWMKEYVEAKTANRVTNATRYRYRHPEIKLKIRKETSDKCAYCESKITHTYPGDIEHILPYSLFPTLIVEWENLTLSCGECNRRKLDYYDAAQPLINPYADEPSDHLYAVGTLIYGKPKNSKGAFAELRLELNRTELLERRLERIKALRGLFERYVNEKPGALKDLLFEEVMKEIRTDKEYTFISKAFIEAAINAV
jgi:5-methylcytosine-specific restriction endonuclease McrA